MSSFDRRTFLKTTGVAGIAALAGCSQSGGGDGDGETTTSTTTSGGSGGETRLSWHAGGTGGTYYPLSNEFKSVIEGHTDYGVQVQSTGASVENVGSLYSGDADFALIQNDIAYFAKNGTGIDAFQDNPIENLRGVATLYPETIHVVTLAESGIETLQDLKGKRVNTGDLGSGTQVDALQILNAVGITQDDFEEQNTSFSQASEQLRNGDVDATFTVGGWPVGAISDLATTEDVRIVPIDGDAREQVKDAASFFADDQIPAGTYSGIDEAVPTVAVQAMIATNAEASADVVENVTAAIFDNVDELTIKTDFISKASAQDGMSIELHEGAQAYFG
ncbi:TAXI family TRAP transporter solute-binding subunit [Halarchaeum sp. CBA1220]|uniref:TAXI family TRAP transporter solute-binding subunit n=1 Tax=Halarchaeum sp. CBA1220 TaxID=1853682 RepID=UPI000F3A94B7|nr:TAXI family TRAP transporter solute-binding subunit [Halarchaeum sp. CBA1220]QLC33498.1 TAXI family TRAP transporter solute-binding subunit [Halarchaeum sp. CBA1220]